MKGVLALEDGSIYEGLAFGGSGETTGEVVFNTSMTGYQEILTDPSYAGQIVVMTYPHIGNYGVNAQDYESDRPYLRGFVVRELSQIYSNWRAQGGLANFLKRYNIIGLQGVDTRALTKRIRTQGAMRAVISTINFNKEELVAKAKSTPGLVGVDLVSQVTTNKADVFSGNRVPRKKNGQLYKVVALDFGIKANILKALAALGCRVHIVPAKTSYRDILAYDPDGVFLSNGPGDPAAVTYAIETVKKLIGKKPIFGICLGHQLLALALGGKTYKLKFGHHGANHPVKNLDNQKVEITAQNHGFAVDLDSLGAKVKLTHLNLNDQTVEGFKCLNYPAFAVQYHPEAGPGPHDSLYLFQEFVNLMSAKAGS
jgi:carbamoyl-phosphate synthase small subunit